jgi:hypothetical protein
MLVAGKGSGEDVTNGAAARLAWPPGKEDQERRESFFFWMGGRESDRSERGRIKKQT